MMDSGWNQIVSCTFWCGLDEHWSFDFQKVILIEIISGNLCNLMTQNHLFLQGLSSQVEVTVFEAEFLFYLALVGDFKWRGLRFGQDAKLADIHLDFAGGDFGIDCFSLTDHTFCDQNILGMNRSCFLEYLSVGTIVKYQLYHAGAVTQVDEDQMTFISLFLHPSANNFFFADVLFGKSAAIAGSL